LCRNCYEMIQHHSDDRPKQTDNQRVLFEEYLNLIKRQKLVEGN